MRKIAITTLLAGGLLLSAGVFAPGSAQSAPAKPALTHATKHDKKTNHKAAVYHPSAGHHKAAIDIYMHPKKKPQHHAMKKAEPAKAKSGG